jgi:type II secretory ATPase GspE/PulE/Tfp pilus assembly ATPase PilB-like protein
MKLLGPIDEFIITDITHLPVGQYLSFEEAQLPESFARHFALLLQPQVLQGGLPAQVGMDGELDRDLLLVVEDTHFASHEYFDLIHRLEPACDLFESDGESFSANSNQAKPGMHVVQILKVTHEIIKSIHAANVTLTNWVETHVETSAWALIDRAIDQRASDLHIETRGAYAQVFFRIDGERRSQPSISSKSAMDMCNVLYGVHADADNKGVTWDEKTVKDAVIEHRSALGKHVQLRLSSAPIHPSGNFHVVIRLLVMDANTLKPLVEMGYSAQQLELIENMLIGSHGVVFVVGPTNSGKSTSLQALIARIFEQKGRDIKVITVEKPVEYLIASACQMGVPEGRRDLMNLQTGSQYSAFVAATLRQDPDVVMLGEVNDADSATNISQLVLSGRKTLATLHVYEAFGVFARLSELGVPKSVLLMKGFISGIVFQRLVPLLCVKCALSLDDAGSNESLGPHLLRRVLALSGDDATRVRLRGEGCQACSGTGLAGRTLCAEILLPDTHFLSLMNAGFEAQARAHWLAGSKSANAHLGGTAMAHAIQKMRQGLLDPRDIERWLGRLELDLIELEDSTPFNPQQSEPVKTKGVGPRTVKPSVTKAPTELEQGS